MQSEGGPVAYVIVGALGVLIFLVVWPDTNQSALTNVLHLSIPLVFFGFLLYGWRCMRQRNRAILSPHGLCLLGRFNPNLSGMSREPWHAAWSDVGEVRWQPMRMGIVIVDQAGSTLLAVQADFFGSGARSQEFVDRAQAWIERTQRKGVTALGGEACEATSTPP